MKKIIGFTFLACFGFAFTPAFAGDGHQHERLRASDHHVHKENKKHKEYRREHKRREHVSDRRHTRTGVDTRRYKDKYYYSDRGHRHSGRCMADDVLAGNVSATAATTRIASCNLQGDQEPSLIAPLVAYVRSEGA